jgi:Zn-finger nucleic acid-binding protein
MRLKPDMESFKCDYCQSVYFPEKNDDGVRVLGETTGQDCPGCHGMLVPMQALEGLVDELRTGQGSEAAPAAPDTEDLRRKINCPECHHAMDAHFYAGPGNVVIDSCEECCLIWLDRGALMRIARAPDVPSPASSEWA